MEYLRSEKHSGFLTGSRLVNDRADTDLGLSDSLACLAKSLANFLHRTSILQGYWGCIFNEAHWVYSFWNHAGRRNICILFVMWYFSSCIFSTRSSPLLGPFSSNNSQLKWLPPDRTSVLKEDRTSVLKESIGHFSSWQLLCSPWCP